MRAIIDIGSNSVRLLITDNHRNITKKLINSTALAENLANCGKLSSSAMDRTIVAVADFYTKATEANAETFIFATEAVRKAKNKNEFLTKLSEVVPCPIDVLSGETEAELGFFGVTLDSGDDKCSVIDIGGASVEFVSGENKQICYKKSLPIGCVRLFDMFNKNLQSFNAYITEQFNNYEKISVPFLYAIGGTASSIASMLLNQKVYDEKQTHGYIINLNALEKLSFQLFALSPMNISKTFATISLKRANIIAEGSAVLLYAAKYFNADFIKVSELDNMEGYLEYIDKKR